MDDRLMRQVSAKRKTEDVVESKKFYHNKSQQRLSKIITTKIRTAFIGAICSIEESEFGELFGFGKKNAELTPNQKEWLRVWQKLRTKILNNGNAQIRASEAEISQYDISWNRYHNVLEVKDGGSKE